MRVVVDFRMEQIKQREEIEQRPLGKGADGGE